MLCHLVNVAKRARDQYYVALTTGLYWSYTLLFKLSVLMYSWFTLYSHYTLIQVARSYVLLIYIIQSIYLLYIILVIMVDQVVSSFSYLLNHVELADLLLVVDDEWGSPGTPTSQILLPSYVHCWCVQHWALMVWRGRGGREKREEGQGGGREDREDSEENKVWGR